MCDLDNVPNPEVTAWAVVGVGTSKIAFLGQKRQQDGERHQVD